MDRRLFLTSVVSLAALPAMSDFNRGSMAPRKVIDIDIDDVSLDLMNEAILEGYAPELEALIPLGRSFPLHYAASLCSIYRAQDLVGREPQDLLNTVGRNVIGTASESNFTGPQGKRVGEEMLGIRTWRGKVHLFGQNVWLSEVLVGFDEFRGFRSGQLGSYLSWQCGVADKNGTSTSTCNTFATNDVFNSIMQDISNDVDFIKGCFPFCHNPLIVPPPQNEPPGATYLQNPGIEIQKKQYLRHGTWRLSLIIQAAIANDYIVLVRGDNGEDINGKGTVENKGLVTPLYIWGNGVLPGVSQRPVQAIDAWSTIRWLRGCSDWTSAPESKNFADDFLVGVLSFGDSRQYLTAVAFDSIGLPIAISTARRTVRDRHGYKLNVDSATGVTSFFDVSVDPDELNNLEGTTLSPDAQRARDRLEAHLPSLS